MEKRRSTISKCRLCGFYQIPHKAIFSAAGRSQSLAGRLSIFCELNLSAEADDDCILCRSCWRKVTSVVKSTEALRTLVKKAGAQPESRRSAVWTSSSSPSATSVGHRRSRSNCEFSLSGATPIEKRRVSRRLCSESIQPHSEQPLPSTPTSVARVVPETSRSGKSVCSDGPDELLPSRRRLLFDGSVGNAVWPTRERGPCLESTEVSGSLFDSLTASAIPLTIAPVSSLLMGVPMASADIGTDSADLHRVRSSSHGHRSSRLPLPADMGSPGRSRLVTISARQSTAHHRRFLDAQENSRSTSLHSSGFGATATTEPSYSCSVVTSNPDLVPNTLVLKAEAEAKRLAAATGGLMKDKSADSLTT